jgi:hypothetical protein
MVAKCRSSISADEISASAATVEKTNSQKPISLWPSGTLGAAWLRRPTAI